jgi:hypothetical protein
MGTWNRQNRLLEPVMQARTSRNMPPAAVGEGLPRPEERKPAARASQNRRSVRKDAAGKRRNVRKVAAEKA